MAETNRSEMQIVLDFSDKASPKIKRAFDKSAQAAKKMSTDVDKSATRMQRSLDKATKNMAKDTDKLTQSQKRNERQMKKNKQSADHYRFGVAKLRREFANFRNLLLLVFFVFRPLINLMKGSLEDFARQEDAINRLNHALKIQGSFTRLTSIALQDMATAFQKVTRFGNEAVEEVMQQLLTVGGLLPQELRGATQATLDLATATGRDLRTASLIMAKAAAGYTGELSRYGIIIDRNLSKTKKFAAVLKFINDKMGGAAQADIESYSGSMQQLANAFHDFREDLGEKIVESLGLKGLSKEWKEIFEIMSHVLTVDKQMAALGRGRVYAIEKEIAATEKALEVDRKRVLNFERFTFPWEKGMFAAALKRVDTYKARLIALNAQLKGAEKAIAPQRKIDQELQAEQAKANRIKKSEKFFNDEIMKMASEKAKMNLEVLDSEYKDYLETGEKKLIYEEYYSDQRTRLIKKVNQALATEGNVAAKIMVGFGTNMTKALDDTFFNVVMGRFESLKEVVTSFGEAMLRVLTDLAAKKSVDAIFDAIGAVGGAGKTTKTVPSVASHSGGYMRHGASASYGVPKFHSGGEVPAILQAGEGVVSRKGMKSLGVSNLDKLNRGEDTGGNVVNNYYIQTIDERSFRDRLAQNPDIYENATANGVTANKNIRRTIQRFGR